MKVIAQTTNNTLIVEISREEFSVISSSIPITTQIESNPAAIWEANFRDGIQLLHLGTRLENSLFRAVFQASKGAGYAILFRDTTENFLIPFQEWILRPDKHEYIQRIYTIGDIGKKVIITAIENYKKKL